MKTMTMTSTIQGLAHHTHDAVINRASAPLFIRQPTTDDGWGIYELVKACPPLDLNSGYSYVLLATQFRDSCAIATDEEGEVVGFVSGYTRNDAPQTFFLWQIAVACTQQPHDGSACRLLFSGIYEDEFERSDGRWRFAVRRGKLDLPSLDV